MSLSIAQDKFWTHTLHAWRKTFAAQGAIPAPQDKALAIVDNLPMCVAISKGSCSTWWAAKGQHGLSC